MLVDLDGVVRHFDPSHVTAVERRHGLLAGCLAAAAFEPELLEPLVTGQISRAAWVRAVGNAVGSSAAAEEWMAEQGSVDPAIMLEIDRLRATGHVVAVLTNGTDTIPDEMLSLGLANRFDRIFNSAEIGFAKPDRRAFEHVCRELAVDPREVFFTDDTASKLAGARDIGMTARLYEGVATFRRQLEEFGLRD